MVDQPNSDTEQQKGTHDAGQPPPPPLLPKKEAGDSGTDPEAGKGNPGAQAPPKTRWQRFKTWVWPMDFSDAVMLTLTAAIAIGTVVSAAAIFLQWREMVKGGTDTGLLVGYAQRQADDADKIKLSADKQANAAQQFADTAVLINNSLGNAVEKLDAQAKASAASIKATQEAMRLDQRAWVGVLAQMDKPEVGKPLIGKALITNSGKTFAVKMTIQTHLAISRTKLDVLPTIPSVLWGESIGLLIPNRPYESHVTFRDASGTPLKSIQQEIDNLTTGGFYVYIFGEVHYNDVFQQPHETDFCWWRSGTEEVDFIQCDTHNTAD